VNSFQIITGVWFLALLVITKPNPPLVVSIANFCVALLICLAMDLGAIDRDGATLSMMIVDLAAGAALVTRPGFSRVMAATFGVSSLLHALNLGFGVSLNSTFAVVYTVNVVQLGALSIGSCGGSGLRRRLGFRRSASRSEAPAGNLVMGGISVADLSGDR